MDHFIQYLQERISEDEATQMLFSNERIAGRFETIAKEYASGLEKSLEENREQLKFVEKGIQKQAGFYRGAFRLSYQEGMIISGLRERIALYEEQLAEFYGAFPDYKPEEEE